MPAAETQCAAVEVNAKRIHGIPKSEARAIWIARHFTMLEGVPDRIMGVPDGE